MDNLNRKVKRAVVFDFVSRIINQSRSFVVSIFLARILSPADFGIVGLALTFVSIASLFTNFGLGVSLIQKDELNEEDYSSVFWLNVFAGLGLTLILIGASFFAGWFYASHVLCLVLICMSFSVLINSFNIVQNALLIKRLENKIQVSSNVVSGLLASGIAISMAFTGWGLWSLVASVLIGDIIKTGMLWWFTSWRPMLMFSWQIIHKHFSSSKYLFFSTLLNNVAERLDAFVIGKLYSFNALGIYQRAQNLNQLAVTYSSASLFKVLLPTFSQLKQDKKKFDKFALSSLHLVSFIVFALAGFMYCSADMVVLLLYSSKWIASVGYYKVMAFSVYAYPVSAILVNIISGKEENKAFFKLEVIKKIMLLISFPIGFIWGIYGYLYSFTVVMFLSVLTNIYFVHRIAQIPSKKMMFAIFPYSVILLASVLFNRFTLSENLIQSNILALGLYTIFLCVFCFLGKLEGVLAFTRLMKKAIKKT